MKKKVINKKKRIDDLEEQNDRLKKEIQRLQQLNQQNDRVKDLESENNRLLTELQTLNDSKLKLAVTANNTIDELRKYLIEYQNAVINGSK